MDYDITIANLTRSYLELEAPDRFVPMGPLHIVSVLEEKGYSVEFRDYLTLRDNTANPTSTDNIVAFLEGSADLLGISCVGSMLPLILPALEILKKRHPNKTIIMGGIGPSEVARELLTAFPFLDIVVKGEGEITIVELMDYLSDPAGKDLDAVKGIVYRDRTGVHETAPRALIGDLDRIPFPAYYKLDFKDYSAVPLITSRGCPFRCTFCDTAPFWERQYRKRSIAKVMEEVDLLASRYGQKRLEVVDDTFPVDKERVLQFCARLKERHPDISWSSFSRVDTIDEEVMEAMAGSGCCLVLFGVDSGSDSILKQIHKKTTRQQVEQVIFRAANYFEVVTSLIWGFPFETMTDFYQTLELFRSVASVSSTTFLMALNPFALSDIYREYGDAIGFTEEWGRLVGGIENKSTLELIKRHPKIFPGFYYYQHADFEKKFKVVKDTGLINTFLSCRRLCSNA